MIANTVITAKAFRRSIEIAFRNPPDRAASIERLKHIIKSLPEGTLYCSNHGSYVDFYTIENNHQKHISKKSVTLYPLARKKYLLLLQEILELTGSTKAKDVQKRQALIEKLKQLITTFETGNLEIARIVLSSTQYKWFTKRFWQKHINKSSILKTASKIPVRSKSERDIINNCETLAVPLHYEEAQFIYVQPLVDKLERQLISTGYIAHGGLYTYMNEEIHWNVPPELNWMNLRGSIWKSYDPVRGRITIHADITIMLADGTLFIWEHEGLMDDFLYRCNASERAAVLKYTGAVAKENLLETYEHEIDTQEKLIDIIEREILPRLWF